MPASIGITTIISDDENAYPTQQAGLMPDRTRRSYQPCTRGDARIRCAVADRRRKPATSGTMRTRVISSGTATSLSVTRSMGRNELVTGSEKALASASIAEAL